jgi:hypothetical protein
MGFVYTSLFIRLFNLDGLPIPPTKSQVSSDSVYLSYTPDIRSSNLVRATMAAF